METDDPFASVAALCHISSSQEEHLRRCRFAGEPEDEPFFSGESSDIPVASTEIMIVSPPESPEENQDDDNIPRDNDVFITPPEESTLAASQEEQQQTVAVDNRDDPADEGVANNEKIAAVDGNCADDLRAVDLGRDTDLGFSAGVELTDRIAIDSGSLSSPVVDRAHEDDVIGCESLNTWIMNRELASSDDLRESLLITPKTADKNVGSLTTELCLGSETEKTLARVKKLKSSSKKSKILDENLVLETSKNTLDTETENLGEIVDSSGLEGFSPSNCLKSLRNHQIEEVDGGDREFHGDNSAKRKFDFNTEALESNFEENIAVLEISEGRIEGGNEEIEDDEANRPCNISERFSDAKFPEKQNDIKAKNIDDIDKFRYVGPMGAKRSLNAKFSEKQNDDEAKNIDDIDKFRYANTVGANSLEKQRDVRARHALPKSLCRNNANVGGEAVHDVVLCSRNFKEVTILDVLNILPEDYNYDPSLANVSVLEAAKRRGINFP
ncbi:hypothetical protein P3X46_016471 [Hevea brasiliensis]|uniref:Uncharacterized protein n=1 Tax=Hevea brasiliensis TaxID=3981 RepID=A0ABQ9M2S6_HEVBR|nr:hypothetical protein P3X46_016471 [Hevea brasiliensis]